MLCGLYLRESNTWERLNLVRVGYSRDYDKIKSRKKLAFSDSTRFFSTKICSEKFRKTLAVQCVLSA